MAPPAAAVAPRPGGVDLPGMALGAVLVVVLGALLVAPLAAVGLEALRSPAPPLVVVALTLAVAGVAALGALGMAGILVAALRVGAPGRAGLVAICRAGALVPPFVAPLAILALTGPGGPAGHAHGAAATDLALLAIALAQAFAFAPHAVALLSRALSGVTAEAEQAAELLGASGWIVLRRVTLGLARPALAGAGLAVLGLCLGDVTAPLVLGFQDPAPAGLLVLAGLVGAGAHLGGPAATAALLLSLLTVPVALAGRTWRYVTVPLAPATSTSAGLRPRAVLRGALATLAWIVAGTLVALWAVVVLTSLVSRPALAVRPLLNSVALGLGVAIVGTALALAVARLALRAGGVTAAALGVLARVPVAVAGVGGGLGYLLIFGAPGRDLTLVVMLVVAWELPITLRVAGNVLARADRSTEQAALTLGAGPLTTLRRVLLPALRPSAAWLLCHGFVAGVASANTVVAFALAEDGRQPLAVLHMLASASTGSVGAACAVATVLLALASGAALLGRAAAGRESLPTLLA